MTQTFRDWLRLRYQEHCQETDGWGVARLNSDLYFQKYRWWLRREYRHSQRQLKAPKASRWDSIQVIYPPEDFDKTGC